MQQKSFVELDLALIINPFQNDLQVRLIATDFDFQPTKQPGIVIFTKTVLTTLQFYNILSQLLHKCDIERALNSKLATKYSEVTNLTLIIYPENEQGWFGWRSGTDATESPFQPRLLAFSGWRAKIQARSGVLEIMLPVLLNKKNWKYSRNDLFGVFPINCSLIWKSIKFSDYIANKFLNLIIFDNF